MVTLTPTGGATSCPIYLGAFSWTYDGSTSTLCMFREGTCISEWYWDIPVKVTKFNIFSHYYHSDSYITGIWGRVGGDWLLLWSGIWNPGHAVWDSKVIECSNCTGIRISQMHALQTLKSGIAEVTVDYDVIPEGNAYIVSVTKPSTFTPGVQFRITTIIRNDGASDTLFVKLTNTDTGDVLHDEERLVYSGYSWTAIMDITLTQTTAFNWLVEAGHVED